MNNQKIKSVLETLMFTWGEPLDVKEAAKAIDEDWHKIYDLMLELEKEYDERNGGIKIRRINKAFQFVTNEENFEYLEKFFTPVKNKRLSQSAMEVLAIVAYKQPVTRGEIESIRGIRCEKVLERLEDRDLIKNLGRSDAIGRPILYGTTTQFLQYMNIESLKELPKIDDLEWHGQIDEKSNDESHGEIYLAEDDGQVRFKRD